MLQKGEPLNDNRNSDTIMVANIEVKPKRLLFGFHVNCIEDKAESNGKLNGCDNFNSKKLVEQQPKYVGVILLAFIIVFGKLLLHMGMYTVYDQ